MKICIRWGTGLGLAWALCGAAFAQTAAPVVVGGTAAKPALTPEERAKRDADKVFHWIRLNADRPQAKPTAAAPAPKPAVKAVAAAKPAVRTEAMAEPAPQPPTTVATADTSLVASREIEPPPQVALASPRSEPIAAPAPVAAPEPASTAEQELRLVHKVAPEFPRQLAGMINNGTVIVRFMVQPDGSVRNAEALKSAHRKLSQAALTAINQWRFAPIGETREATVEIGFSTTE